MNQKKMHRAFGVVIPLTLPAPNIRDEAERPTLFQKKIDRLMR